MADRDPDTFRRDRATVADLLRAQDEDRQRLATGLHDGAVQALAAVALRIGLLRRNLTDRALIEQCEELEAIVADAIADLRRLIAALETGRGSQ